MRLAILGDIHGNSIALDAVLADLSARGAADAYWALGDLVAYGHDPAGVLDRLARLPGFRAVRGNTDRYVAAGDRPGPGPAGVRADPELLPAYFETSESLAWTQGALAATGWLPWLAALPVEQRLSLPDGTRLLAAHAAPGADDGPGITAATGDAALAALVAGCAADLVCVGHTHRPLDRRAAPPGMRQGNGPPGTRQGNGPPGSDGVRVVNAGSLGNGPPDDRRASYVLLDAGPQGYRLTFHRVAYDYAAVAAAVERLRHPGRRFIVSYLDGGAVSPRGGG